MKGERQGYRQGNGIGKHQLWQHAGGVAEEEFMTVGRFNDAIAAELARAKLESAGIEGHLGDEMTVSVDWQLTNALGGIRLRVARADAQAARAILQAAPAPTADVVAGDALTPREKKAERAATVALFGVLFGPLLLYALWLIFAVLAEPGELRAAVRRQFRLAMVVTFGALTVFAVLLGYIISAR